MRNYPDRELSRLVERPSAYNMITPEDSKEAIERINAYPNLKLMADQAEHFRDLALSYSALLNRAAEALTKARQGESMQTAFYAGLIAELHEAAKVE
jgi:hypothetical protein